jgi:hypothetical protein
LQSKIRNCKVRNEKIFYCYAAYAKGYQCKFKVYKTGTALWDFFNDNNELTIHIYKAPEGDWQGILSYQLGGAVQNNILITQAIFELAEFYKHL